MKQLSVLMLFLILIDGFHVHLSFGSQDTTDDAIVSKSDDTKNSEDIWDDTTDDSNASDNLDSNSHKQINDEVYSEYVDEKDGKLNERSYLLIGHLYKKAELSKDSSSQDSSMIPSKFARVKLDDQLELSKLSDEKENHKTLLLNDKEYSSSFVKLKANDAPQKYQMVPPCEFLFREDEIDNNPDDLSYWSSYNGVEILKKVCQDNNNNDHIMKEYFSKDNLLNLRNNIQDKVYKTLKVNKGIFKDRRVTSLPNLLKQLAGCSCRNQNKNSLQIRNINNGTVTSNECVCKNI